MSRHGREEIEQALDEMSADLADALAEQARKDAEDEAFFAEC